MKLLALPVGLVFVATTVSAAIVGSNGVNSLFVLPGGLVLAISTVLVTIAALFMFQPVPKWRLCLLPALALASFALAFYLVGTHQFLPTA